jgi:nitroreductase
MPAIMDLIRSRRSIRRFLPRPVEREKIVTCLEAARLAPSAHNAQPWRFIVIDDPGLKENLCSEAFTGIYKMSRFAAQAPVVIVVLCRMDFVAHRLGGQIQRTGFHLIDIGIAGEHFVLQAEELGLATCWMGWFNNRKARRVLKVPRRYKIIAFLPVGYAASRPPRETVRIALDEIAWWNGFEKKEEGRECGSERKPES